VLEGGAASPATDLCNAMAQFPGACSLGAAVGFFCANDSFSMAGMPAALGFDGSTIGVYGPTGTGIAGAYNTMLTSGMGTAFSGAGVIAGGQTPWSGCLTDGTTWAALDCQSWSTTSPDTSAVLMNSDATGAGWETFGTVGCDASMPIVCICYASG